MRLGAYDFMVKPLSPSRLVTAMRGAVEVTKSVRADVTKDRNGGSRTDDFAGFIGSSPPMQEVYRQIKKCRQFQGDGFRNRRKRAPAKKYARTRSTNPVREVKSHSSP